MKTFLIGAAILALAPGLAHAANKADSKSDVSAAYKGTIVSTYPDGRQGKLWLEPGGLYKAEGRRHDASDGKWKIKGNQICLRQSHPATLPISYCTTVPSGPVGSSWSAKSVMGDPIKVKLVEGGRPG